MNAAALMTADQYRAEAQKMLRNAENYYSGPDPCFREYLIGCAQVYALLAISAQTAENANEGLPF